MVKYYNEAEEGISNEDIYDFIRKMNETILNGYDFIRGVVVLDNYIFLSYNATPIIVYKNNSSPIAIVGTEQVRDKARIVFEHMLKNEGLLKIKLEERKLEEKLGV